VFNQIRKGKFKNLPFSGLNHKDPTIMGRKYSVFSFKVTSLSFCCQFAPRPAHKLLFTALEQVQVFKLAKISLVFANPPWGWNLALWDTLEAVWTALYWKTALQSLASQIQALAALVVFGDLFNMLPPLIQGISEYNSWAPSNQAGEWVKPVQICLNKSNNPHKGTRGYLQVENAFMWFFQKAPKITELPYKLNRNLLTVPQVQGNHLIPHWNGSSTLYNPTQKSHLWLKVF
jgi:hypothetical protein